MDGVAVALLLMLGEQEYIKNCLCIPETTSY